MLHYMTLGRVKWFNNTQGFGFITHKAENGDADVFVHHSGIKASEGQFKYLVPGEYVDFEITTAEDGKTHADSVTGVQGGVLMCETRAEIFKSRAQASGEANAPEGGDWTQVSRRPSGGRGRGGRGRGGRSGRGRAQKGEEVTSTPRD